MSVGVALNVLDEHLAERGGRAHLVTVGDGGGAHVVSVMVNRSGDALTVGAGRTTADNVAANPAVTLLWAAPPGDEYSLIVDGTAALVEDAEGSGGESPSLSIRPTAAVLHRVADAPGDGPTCVRLDADP